MCDDAGAGEAVAVGVDGARHALVGRRVVDKTGYFVDNLIEVGADEFHGAGGKGFGALCGVAHHEYGFAQSGGFFLNASAVGEHYRGFFHKIDERQVFKRLDEEHIAEVAKVVAEHFVYRPAYVGVEVHRIYEVNIGIFLREMLDGAAHGDEAVAEVLAAVSGDEHELLSAGETGYVVAGIGKRRFELVVEAAVGFNLADHPIERVDYGVACDSDFCIVNVFFQQVLAAEWCWGKVVGGYAPGDLAVHFLGPRAVDVVGA